MDKRTKDNWVATCRQTWRAIAVDYPERDSMTAEDKQDAVHDSVQVGSRDLAIWQAFSPDEIDSILEEAFPSTTKER